MITNLINKLSAPAQMLRPMEVGDNMDGEARIAPLLESGGEVENSYTPLSFSTNQSTFLAAAGIPATLDGAGLVTEIAVSCTKAAAGLWPESAIAGWHEIARSIRSTLRTTAARNPDKATPLYKLPVGPSSTLKQLTKFKSTDADLTFHITLAGLLGRCWVLSAYAGNMIPTGFMAGLRTLRMEYQRTGKRSSEWRHLVEADLTDPAVTEFLIRKIGPKGAPTPFLQILLVILNTGVEPAIPELRIAQGASIPSPDFEEEIAIRAPAIEGGDQMEPHNSSPDKSQNHLDTRRISARLSAADYSSALTKLGIEHRDHLLLDDLCVLTRKLATGIGSSDRLERGYAAFHLVCLLTTTSDLYALEIQLQPHAGHIWLDIERGTWCWDFSQYRYNGKQRPDQLEIEAIAVPLPISVVEIFSEFWPDQTSGTLEDAVCKIQGVAVFDLDAARAYLRSQGDPVHPPYRARWASSLTSAILQLTGSDMFAAITTAQFAAAAPAALFYYCPTYHLVYVRLNQVFERLGLGPAVTPYPPTSFLGSNNPPPSEIIHLGWGRLVHDCNQLRTVLMHSTNEADALEVGSRYMNLLAASFVIQSAHRCARFDQLSFGALCSSHQFMVILDKELRDEAARAHPRLLGKTNQISAIVSLAIECHNLIVRLIPAGRTSANSPLFASFSDRLNRSLQPVTPDAIAHVIRDYFQGVAANFGRSLWITELDRWGCDHWLIRVLSGHVRDITRTTGPFFDVPPADAAALLSAQMDRITTTVFGNARLTAPSTATHLFVPTHPDHTQVITARQAQISPQLILEPITVNVLLHSVLAQKLRVAIRTVPRDSISARALLLLHFLLIDLLDGDEIALSAVEDPAQWISTNGPRPGIRWRRPHFVHEVWIPICPESALLCGQVGTSTASREAISGELKSLIDTTLSVTLDGDVLAHLCSWARGYKRVFFPPTLLASATSCVESPCLNSASIERLAKGTNKTYCVEEFRDTFSAPRASVSQDISQLSTIINKFANTEQRLGERRKRAVDALREIQELPIDLWTARGAWLKEWIVEELQRSRDNTLGRYEISSLNTYFSRLKVGLDHSMDDPLDWTELGWEFFIRNIEARHCNQQFKFGDSLSSGTRDALGALARSLARRQHGLPSDIWCHIKPSDGVAAPRNSASATLITEFDRSDTEALLSKVLGNYQPNLVRARFRIQMGTLIPMRTGEYGNLKRAFLTGSGGIVIERSGFNSIKNQQSVRVWQLDSSDLFKVKNLAHEIGKYVCAGDLLLRGRGSGQDNEQDLRSVGTLGWALKLATGDPKARLHSLRATTLQNLAWPGWQSACSKYLNFELSARERASWVGERKRAWLSTSTAAAAAGHSGISAAIHYYQAGWPLVHAVHAGALSDELDVSAAYLETLGLSATAYRQAKSRANRQCLNTFSVFDWFEQQLKKRVREKETKFNLPSKKLTDSPPPSASRVDTSGNAKVTELERTNLIFLALRAMGEASTSAQNRLLLPDCVVARLNSLLPKEEEISECVRRARHGPTPRAISGQLNLLHTDWGQEQIDWVVGLNAEQFDCACYSLLWFLPHRKGPNRWLSFDWKELTTHLPHHLKLKIQRGTLHISEDDLKVEKNAKFFFKAERDLGSRHRASIAIKEQPDNRVFSARLTSITQILLLCRQQFNRQNTDARLP